MSRNPTFVQALANVTGLPVEVAPVVEATTLGAAFLAGVGIGVWSGVADIDALWSPAHTATPDNDIDRDALGLSWGNALTRAAGWIPDLSALDF